MHELRARTRMDEAEAGAELLLADGLCRCGEEQRLLTALPEGWERSADALVDVVVQWLQAPSSGSFHDETTTHLYSDLLVDLATHALCGPERVLDRIPVACTPRLWDALCQTVGTTAPDVRLSDRRRAALFSRIFGALSTFPRQMTHEVTYRAQRGVDALSALLDLSPRGARFVLLSGFDLSSSSSGKKSPDSHWILAPIILRAAHRRRELRKMLSWPTLRAVAFTENLLDLAIATPVLPEDEYIGLTPHAEEDQRQVAVANVREFLRHSVDQDWIKQTLSAGLVECVPGMGKEEVSNVLVAAIAAEIEDLLRICNGNLAVDATGKGFERWIQLSDLIYACARDGLIRLDAVLTAISDQRNDDLGGAALGMIGPSDTTAHLFAGGRATVWLLAQCSTETLRDALSSDSQAATPSLLPAFLQNFGEPQGYLLSEECGSGLAVWDWLPEAGLFSIIFRASEMFKLNERAAAQDYSVVPETAMRLFPNVKEACFLLAKRHLEREALCNHIWTIAARSEPGVMTSVLGEASGVEGSAGVACFATLSHMMATQIATMLHRFLCSPELDAALAAVPIRPDGQTRSPHRQLPLPLRILSSLSVPCRCKLRDKLDSALTGKAVGRGVWETYARLLFLTPRSCFHCEMAGDVRGIVTVLSLAPFVNVLELVELRLIPLLARLVNRGAGTGGEADKKGEGSPATFVLWLWRHYTTLAEKMSVSNNAASLTDQHTAAAAPDPMDSLRLSVYVEIQEVLLALLTSFPQLLLVGTELMSSSVSVRGWNPFLPRVGVRAALSALRSDCRGPKQQAGMVESLSRLSEATSTSQGGGHTAQLRAMHGVVHPELEKALSSDLSMKVSEGGSSSQLSTKDLKGDHLVYYAVNSMTLRAAVVATEHRAAADLILIALLRNNRATQPTTQLSPPPADGSAIDAGGAPMTPDEHLSLEMVLCLSWYLYAVRVPAMLQPEYINVDSIRSVVAGLGGRALLEAAPAVLNYIISSTPPRPTDVNDSGAWTARANFNMALSKWVWDWKLLPLSAVVLYLGEVLSAGRPQTADAAHHHLEYLLVKDNVLTSRLNWLVEIGPSPLWWREDDDMRKESDFRSKFPPPIGSAMSSMTECQRLLPTLDIVLGCLVEATEGESDVRIRHNLRSTLSTIISSVVPKIYPFHPTGVAFLLRFLSTYYNCPVLNAPLKDALIRGVLGRGTSTDPSDTIGSALEFFAPDLCAPSETAQSRGSPRCTAGGGHVAVPAGTVGHFSASLERAANAWRPVVAGTSRHVGTRAESVYPAVSWPRWDDLIFGEFSSAAEAAAAIPRLEFLRAAAPWECAAPGEPPLPSPAKKMVAQPRTHIVGSATPSAEKTSAVLENFIAAAIESDSSDCGGANAGARIALAAMVLERIPVEMVGEIPTHFMAFLHKSIARAPGSPGATCGRRPFRTRLIRLVQGYLMSETGRDLLTLKHFGDVLTTTSAQPAEAGAKAEACDHIRPLLHLHFAVAALAPSISSCLQGSVAPASGRIAGDQLSAAAQLLCNLLRLMKELCPQSEWTGDSGRSETKQAGASEKRTLQVRNAAA